jgi:hypothetical protein
MKKIIFTLTALAALSTVSLASNNRSWDLRDSDTYFGKYSTQLKNKATSVKALAVAKQGKTQTNYERLLKISIENDQHGRH